MDVKDFQLFSPYSDKRSLLSSNKDDDFSTRKRSHYYGVGVVLEATNNIGKRLRDAWFEGELPFVAGGEAVRCAFDVNRIGGGLLDAQDDLRIGSINGLFGLSKRQHNLSLREILE